ncbi:Receptor like protein 43, putative [Theobroma cacao]|uniref:Receptor like protein 43, putative n=1 Tax=Theobroma cacao TaxID=3641 RepID=A0A061EIQ4_THECC|nr:Receptor like protein 43, putative [Theobroma cacao]
MMPIPRPTRGKSRGKVQIAARGVECYNNTGHVIGLDLGSSYLYGSINSSSSLFRLVHLQRLSLAENFFHYYKIPSAIRNLSKLTSLDLRFSSFSGEIPSEIFELSHLEYIDLSRNSLKLQKQGFYILAEKLTKLSELYLSDVKISSRVPAVLANLSSLAALILKNCSLHSELPTGILQLPNLKHLSLELNPDLAGYIPNIHGSYPLMELSLANTNFSGQLPESIGKLKSLQLLDINHCRFEGSIPTSIANVSQLTYLSLSTNNFSPRPLSWLGKQTKLNFLDLIKTNLYGNIPPSARNLTKISELYLGCNQLDGQIANWIGDLTHQTLLKLQENKLVGPIPQSISRLENLILLDLQSNFLNGMRGCSLRMINFAQNQLQGKIPRSLAYCTMLEALNLGKNQIYDTFPFWLGVLPNLKVLVLRSNRLHGAIRKPQSSSEFSKLQIIDISDNNLGGELLLGYFNIWNAMKVANAGNLSCMNATTGFQKFSWSDYYRYSIELTNKGVELEYESVQDSFTAIDPSNNKFNGEIHEDIRNLKAVNMLNLSNNNLTDHISSSLANLTHLESMDLSRNKLSGEIPQQLVQLTFLSFFDVSHNRFKGPIPSGRQFSTFDTNSFLGNLGLCGSPLPKKCGIPDESSGQDPLNSEEDKGIGSLFAFDWKVVLVGFAAGLIIGMPLGCNFINRKHGRFLMVLGNKQLRRREKKRRHKFCF